MIMTNEELADMSKFDSIHADAMVDGSWEAEVLLDCMHYFGR